MALLLDTHVVVWLAAGSDRLTQTALAAIMTASSDLFMSAVAAWEYSDLEARGRLGGSGPLQPLLDNLAITLMDFPSHCFELVADLPLLHRDPIDRMQIAHAKMLGLTLVTADATMRRYPVETLW